MIDLHTHTTASDALWAGCPVLTVAGQTFPSRVAGSLLRALGLPELITTSLLEYEEMALCLACRLRVIPGANQFGFCVLAADAEGDAVRHGGDGIESVLFEAMFREQRDYADEVIVEQFHYVAPDEPIGFEVRAVIVETLETFPISLCIIDGITEALALCGLKSTDNDDVARFLAVAIKRPDARFRSHVPKQK